MSQATLSCTICLLQFIECFSPYWNVTAEASTLVVAFDLGVAVDDDDMGLDVVVVVDAQRPILIGIKDGV